MFTVQRNKMLNARLTPPEGMSRYGALDSGQKKEPQKAALRS
jgi:hypothetical protein